MTYNVGMYGGSFDPLHIGHIHNIIRAASICDELYVVISWSKTRDNIRKELRYRWILNSVKHLHNVKVILVEDTATSKTEYNESYWEKGATDIKSAINKKIDVVFCGDDYKGTNRFESLYGPESEVYYFERYEVPVSSTNIRNNPTKYWDYIPKVCRPYYTKKVLVLGGESTGKSVLVQNLALAYNTNFVAEVGRDTCEYAGGEDYMIAEDMYENLLRQKVNMMDAIKDSNRIIFVDTDCLTTLFYSNFLLGNNFEDLTKCENLAKAINSINEWDLVLFLEPDTAFVQDGTRSEEIHTNRIKYSNKIKDILNEHNIKYHCIYGSYLNRFNMAKKLIEEKLDIITEY